MRWFALAVAAACVACGGGGTQIAGSDTGDVVVDSLVDWRTAELPAFPELPGRRSGRLAVRAAGVTEFDRAWRAHAVQCGEPARLLIIAEDDAGGGSILLELPEDSVVTTYPVYPGDPRDVPSPPAANMGFQFFEETGASAYQASDGSVEVVALGDRVSGNLEVEIAHIQTDERARVSGVFHEVDVTGGTRGECARSGEAVDSVEAEGG